MYLLAGPIFLPGLGGTLLGWFTLPLIVPHSPPAPPMTLRLLNLSPSIWIPLKKKPTLPPTQRTLQGTPPLPVP